MDIAIISGGSRGIGMAIAKLLDQKSLDEIWIISRSKNTSYSFSTPIRHLSLDMTNSAFTENVGSALCKNEYCIKYLVCSAGVGYSGKVAELSEEEIERTVSLNCTALSLLTRICIHYMKKGSSIIEIASGAGFLPQPSFSVYAASKSYVISFSRALRQELKKSDINVTCVCPGPVDTDFFSTLDAPEYKKKYLISAEKVAKGALSASHKNKAIYSPTLSIKAVHLISKILPTNLIMKFYK